MQFTSPTKCYAWLTTRRTNTRIHELLTNLLRDNCIKIGKLINKWIKVLMTISKHASESYLIAKWILNTQSSNKAVQFFFADRVRIEYFETLRGSKGVLCHGHYFVKEKAFQRTINWHCMFKKRYGCGARGITEFTDPTFMRLTRKFHCHDVEIRNVKILPISNIFTWEINEKEWNT